QEAGQGLVQGPTHRSRRRTSAPRHARNHLRDYRAGEQDEQPDDEELEPGEQATRARQEAKHHQSEPDIVRLGQRVQTRQRVGEAQQSDAAGEEKENARRDGHNGEDVEKKAHPLPFSLSASDIGRVALLTKATEAKAASSARLSATPTAAATRWAAPAKSRTAPPPVPISCADIIRSASSGPRTMRTNPNARVMSKKPAAAIRKSFIDDHLDQCDRRYLRRGHASTPPLRWQALRQPAVRCPDSGTATSHHRLRRARCRAGDSYRKRRRYARGGSAIARDSRRSQSAAVGVDPAHGEQRPNRQPRTSRENGESAGATRSALRAATPAEAARGSPRWLPQRPERQRQDPPATCRLAQPRERRTLHCGLAPHAMSRSFSIHLHGTEGGSPQITLGQRPPVRPLEPLHACPRTPSRTPSARRSRLAGSPPGG